MNHFFFAPIAQLDVNSILIWTRAQFGERAANRYEALISQAVFDVADEPMRPGSMPLVEIGPTGRLYHLRHAAYRVKPARDRVKSPRHQLLYREISGKVIEIVRVVHEKMDIADSLPDPS